MLEFLVGFALGFVLGHFGVQYVVDKVKGWWSQ